MPAIQWKDEYRTGIAAIDHEHKELVTVINALFETLDKGSPTIEIRTALGDIHMLIEAHFALEERIMRDLQYAAYTLHKADHDKLLDDIRDIMETAEILPGEDITSNLQSRISDWFGIHFGTFDRAFHTLHR